MDILNFIFRIGVILAVYNFMWWLIMLGISVLRGGKPRLTFEVYLIKAVRYGFLADVIYLFTVHQADGQSYVNDLLIAGLVLLIYFIGKMQKRQKRNLFFSVRVGGNMGGLGNALKQIRPAFDMRLEIGVIVFALALLFSFYYSPTLAYNPISNWFLDSILNIEDTPIFGFIFKVIGFFFLLSVLSKIFGGLLVLLTGQGGRSDYQEDDEEDEHFDDYTEVE